MLRQYRSLLLVSLGILIFLVGIILSLYFYERPFDIVSTNISRLGRPSMNPEGWFYSVIGLIISSLIMIGFYWTLPVWKTGHWTKDKLIDLLRALAIMSTVALIGLSVYNADHRLAHKIFGGTYFFTDFFLMLMAAYIAWRHPHVFKGVILICFVSAALDAYFLYSSGKASWAEWSTVACSFTVAFWFSVNELRLYRYEKAEIVETATENQSIQG